jgi:RimJ/RimL family protein N-acetyltransferase
MRYWSTLPWEAIEKAEAMIARDLESMAAGEHIRLGLLRDGDESLIGVCTLFAFVEQCRRAEVGYGLAAHAWGQGYMDEALRALLEYGFGELGLNRVEADIDPRNARSAASLERLGFTREGFLRERWIVGEEVSDTALYGLLARDWKSLPAMARVDEGAGLRLTGRSGCDNGAAMSYRLALEERPTYLHASATGPNTPENMIGILAEVHGACVSAGKDAVLLELGLTGPSLDLASVFRVISKRSDDGKKLRKIAYVENSLQNREKMHFAETVAINRGVNVRLFPDLDAARAWLTEDA